MICKFLQRIYTSLRADLPICINLFAQKYTDSSVSIRRGRANE